MIIKINSGTGVGPTKLSAFDNALANIGVANYNLIRLSSVIPPHSVIEESNKPIVHLPGEWGDRLYVVIAEKRVALPGKEAWAGIGWVQDKKTGKGLFVEHEGMSEKSVRDDIRQSLHALMATRKVDFGTIHMRVEGVTCEQLPACALVIAVYQASAWASDKSVSNDN